MKKCFSSSRFALASKLQQTAASSIVQVEWASTMSIQSLFYNRVQMTPKKAAEKCLDLCVYFARVTFELLHE